jgi:hypothetical protein
MIDDILFYSNEFFVELPTYSSGSIVLIEAQSEYFEIRIPNKEAVSIF